MLAGKTGRIRSMARTFMIMVGRAAEACPKRSEVETRDAVVTRILAATWGLLFCGCG